MNKKENLNEKLELLSALKEDEEKSKKEPVIEGKEKLLEEIKKVKETTPKKKTRTFLILCSFVSLVFSLTYLIYNILKATDQINQPFLIINSSCLLLLNILLVITAFTLKKSTLKKLNTINIIAFLLYIGFQCLVTTGSITLPTLQTVGDFSNTSINDVIKWANEHKIELEQTYEYSDIIVSDHVISQNVPADTLLKEVDKMEVIVSNGPNYESIVNIPDMVGWNVDDVVKKIKEEKLNHVNIEFQFNDTVERDIAYKQSKSGEMRRNDALTIQFSLGKKEDLKPVKLKDLSGEEEFDATLWLKRNGITYEIRYEFDDDIPAGKAIATNPKEGTLITQSETTVTLIISKGPKIVAPDLMTMSLEEITEWAIQNKLVLVYESEYNAEVKAGDIIRVSVKKGDVVETNQRIYIVTSKGSLKMISYKDGDITSLRNFATENKLELTEREEFSDTVEKGKFISVSKKAGDVINSGEGIIVTISLGKSIQIPNFIGMSVSKAKSTCNSLGLSCRFSYVYSSKTKGNIFSQNMSVGSKVIDGTSITLTVSNGTRPSSGGGTSSGGNTGGSTPPTCTEKVLGTLVIQESWLSIGSSSKTISSLKSKLSAAFPGATFNIVAKEHNSMNSGMIHPSTPTNTGTQIKSCHTYTIYVVE